MSHIDLTCFSDAPQQFLICVTIHKAKHLHILNADTFVIVSFDQKHKKTFVYHNSDCPYFNEYFVFETTCTLNELLRKSIEIRVMQRKLFCKRNPVIGELIIDLRSIWESSNHAFFKKWGTLEKQTTGKAGVSAGFIQLDISVVSKFETPAPVKFQKNDFDLKFIYSHLLLAESPNQNAQRTKFLVKVHSGTFELKEEIVIQINFCGYSAKTSICKTAINEIQAWNEYFIFDGYFPSLCQTFVFNLMKQQCCVWIPIAFVEFSLQEMAFNGNSDEIQFPSLGPVYLYFYDTKNPHSYLGKLLVTLESEPSYGTVKHCLNPTLIPTINEEFYWSTIDFTLNLALLEVTCMNIRDKKIKISLCCGENQYPKLFIKIYIDGHLKMIGQLNISHYLYSQTETSKGVFCGVRKEILMKNVACSHSCKNCGCFASKLSYVAWAHTEDEASQYTPPLIEALQESDMSVTIKSNHERLFNCKIFIHHAKIMNGNVRNGMCNPKVVFCVGDFKAETKTLKGTSSPVWNQTLILHDVKIVKGDENKLEDDPISMNLILFDEKKNSGTDNQIGIGFMVPHFKFINNDDEITDKNIIQALFKRNDPPRTSLNLNEHSMEPFHEIKSLRKSIAHAITDLIPFKTKEDKKLNLPVFEWVDLYNEGRVTASVLLAIELTEINFSSNLIPTIEYMAGIPIEIAPELIELKLSANFIGIRSMKNPPRFTEGRFKIELSIGELTLFSGISGKRLGNGYNFPNGVSFGYVSLPTQIEYWHPLTVKHIDISRRKQVIIGSRTITNLKRYFKEVKFNENKPKTSTRMESHQIPEDFNETELEKGRLLAGETTENESLWKKISLLVKLKQIGVFELPIQRKISHSKFNKDYTWWTKYYNSLNFNEMQDNVMENHPNNLKHRLVIYPSELEKQPEFNGFQDWAETIPLYNEGEYKFKGPDKFHEYAHLKASFEIHKIEGREHFLRNSRASCIEPRSRFRKFSLITQEKEVIVRIYIVRGINLRSKDRTGSSDPYIRIDLGDQKIRDRSNYMTNQTSPIFGRRFQLNAILPKDNILKISVMDRDEITSDDLIGTTEIDIEDRWHSKHHAKCGLINEFSVFGYNAWRDKYKPSEILANICNENEIDPPIYYSNKIQVNGVTFDDTTIIEKDEDLKERLSLSVLKQLDKIPGIEYTLVPEHVETRSLYRKDRPGIEQGKLQLWIELHEVNGTPPVIDITPEPAKKFELRVIVWNTSDVILDDKNIFGKKMSDIYVKCWLDDINLAQYTDIHYRSLTGEGTFNWRMIFPIKYNLGEDMMIITKKKSFYEKFDTELKVPPLLKVQIWDNDSFSPDDFLGTLSLNLSNCPIPTKTAEKCHLSKKLKRMNLFNERKGKIDLELELLTELEAFDNPVGLGRHPPNPLPVPKYHFNMIFF
uniref:CSON008109 protein n=1 Tax=Culicoides sonorensis TaxID=179676 RepID=A0A336LYI1_CULSO